MTSNECLLYSVGIQKAAISLEKPAIFTWKKHGYCHVLKLEINSRLLVFVGQFVAHAHKQIDVLPSNHNDVCAWICIYRFRKGRSDSKHWKFCKRCFQGHVCPVKRSCNYMCGRSFQRPYKFKDCISEI